MKIEKKPYCQIEVVKWIIYNNRVFMGFTIEFNFLL